MDRLLEVGGDVTGEERERLEEEELRRVSTIFLLKREGLEGERFRSGFSLIRKKNELWVLGRKRRERENQKESRGGGKEKRKGVNDCGEISYQGSCAPIIYKIYKILKIWNK